MTTSVKIVLVDPERFRSALRSLELATFVAAVKFRAQFLKGAPPPR